MQPTPPDNRTCPDCGTTTTELWSDGRMGCATCYTVFADLVETAVRRLHGTPHRTAIIPPDGDAHRPLPWPTRRAVRREEA